jgi:DNA polymerase II small subunit
MLEDLKAIESEGKRLSLEAAKYIEENVIPKSALESLLKKEIMIISLEDVKAIISEDAKIPVPEPVRKKIVEPEKETDVKVKRQAVFKPIAKEHGPNIKVYEKEDVSGNSRCVGNVQDFVSFFNDRFTKLSRILKQRNTSLSIVKLDELEKKVGTDVRILCMVSDKRITAKGNLFLEVEDETGSAKIMLSSNERKFEEYSKVVRDDVIAIDGRMSQNLFIAKEIVWPDIPIIRHRPKVENDLACIYLSDLHIGSRYFMEKPFKKFLRWLWGDEGRTELAGKVKYIVIAGDIVDGIGVYPTQEKELTITDIFEQYKEFDRVVESLPDYIEVVVGPGNHDAVRRGEPQPYIQKDLIESDVKKIGSPATLEIEGLRHLVYHGTSIDSVIANIAGLSYTRPEGPMIEMLKRRHLSPIYGENLIVPELRDYMVIENEPDVLHMGHIHKNACTKYRDTLVVNSGTFQDRTDFQVRMGHIPTPCIAPVHELKDGRVTHIKFLEED